MKKKVLVSALFALCVAPLAACGGGDDTDKAYAVSVSQTEHGTVAVSAEKAHKGDRITVTVTPDKCYELQTLMCGDMEITSAKSFVMPDNKVTITAVFKEGAHEWGDWSVIDNSTCIKHGSKTRECEECHKIVSEDLELADHDYEFKSDGNVHKKVCTVCSDVEAGSEDTHTYVFSTAGADSIEHWKTCKDCGDIDKETVHAYHTMTGDTCSVCGYEQAAATEGLAYTDIDADTCSVSGMGLADTRDVVIPAFHDGKRVTAIADNAFENETLLESIVIPDSVVTVGESAFGNCSALAKVTIGKNVRSFGWCAFENTKISRVDYKGKAEDWCRITFNKRDSHPLSNSVAGSRAIYLADGSPLESVTVPEDVTAIQDFAFYQCDSIKSITLGSHVTSVGNSAFYNCPAFESIDFGEAAVASIGESAFYGCAIKRIVLPSAVSTIGDAAFHACSSLTNAFLASDVAAIPENCFYGCTALESVALGSSLKTIEPGAFHGCTALASVALPEGLTTIGDGAFNGCETLDNIVLPQSMTSVGSGAFSGCASLSEINVPASVTSLGTSAFFNCRSLASVDIAGGATAMTIGNVYYGQTFANCTSLTEITIPDRVTSLGKETFYGCNGLRTINIGKGVATIGESLFFNCTSLTDINIAPENTHIGFTTGCFIDKSSGTIVLGVGKAVIPTDAAVTSIGKGAFMNNAVLDTIVIPSNITKIGESAFKDCTALTSAELPDGLAETPQFVFAGCVKLQTVTFGSGLNKIGKASFSGCVELGALTIPSSVTEIGASAFNGCAKLDTTVGDNVEWIGVFAFSGCETSFEVHGNLCYVGKWVVGVKDKSTMTTLTADMFKADTVGIGGGAFQAVTALESVTLPSGIRFIGDEAFSECVELTTVVLSDTLEKTGYYAFANCTSIETITIPATVDVIGGAAFYGCSALTSVTLTGNWERRSFTLSSGYVAPSGTAFAAAADAEQVAAQIKADQYYAWVKVGA